MVAKSIKASIFWQGSNVAGIAIIQIVYYALLARILSPEDFGLIAIAQSFLNLATLFAQVGIGPALVQHRNPKNAHLSTAFWSHCGLGLLLYVLTFISASSIGSFFDSDALAAILPILTIGFLFSSASASSLSMIQRSMDFRFLFIAENISFLAGMSTGLSTGLQRVWRMGDRLRNPSATGDDAAFCGVPHTDPIGCGLVCFCL